MLRPHAVVISMLICAVLLAGYNNKHLRVELDKANQVRLAEEQIDAHSRSKRERELKECINQVQWHKDHIAQVENDKKELAVNLTSWENRFNSMKPQADIISAKNKEFEELRDKVKTAMESEQKEREKLEVLQNALDKLAKEEEARNAKNADKAPAHTEKTKNSDTKN